MTHIVWYNENIEEKTAQIIQSLKLNKNMQFGADADIYMMKFWCL